MCKTPLRFTLRAIRFRLYPTPNQEQQLLEHCAHARFVWNLALEQASMYRRHLGPTPSHVTRCKQLTEARAEFGWLGAGSAIVQQQALRDFDQAMRNFWAGTHRYPSWRKARLHEGFRSVQTGPQHVRRLNRRWAEVFILKVGWVRFRWTRPLSDFRSFRVKRERTGQWFVAFAVIPPAIAGPGDGSVVGLDRGVATSLALSTGELLSCPMPDKRRLSVAKRRLDKTMPGSRRRDRRRRRVARVMARERRQRRDWVEKTSTRLASSFDVIRVENLIVPAMVRSAHGTVDAPGRKVAQKAGLNRLILASGWGALVSRLEDKAPGRVQRIDPAFTSRACSVCGHVDAKSRKSQAVFACTTCGNTDHADVNAAKNIAAGHAVRARGAGAQSGPAKNREPQLANAS
ncbi:MAG TPA: transposase [Acidimicrobiales bacterium]|nr:transposase [Acidimicrobiales bacterium]